ncbi:MAG: DUF4198 domain-containing protein [Gemmatimonadales bacterium]
MRRSFRSRARATSLAILGMLVGIAAIGVAHDMFLKPSAYFVAPNATIPSELLNGTFDLSSNSIDRNRIADISVIGPSGRTRIDTTQWQATGDTSRVTFRAGAGGTYVMGVSTKANNIELDAADFNEYLKEDGIPDEIARRAQAGETNADAKERYAKHVKTIVQVGDTPSEGFATALGYPAEIVPVDNPYAARRGGSLRFRLLVDGKAVPNQYLIYGARTANGGKVADQGLRSNAEGIVTIPVSSPGVWFAKFINMRRVNGPDGVTHVSQWASLTFATR